MLVLYSLEDPTQVNSDYCLQVVSITRDWATPCMIKMTNYEKYVTIEKKCIWYCTWMQNKRNGKNIQLSAAAVDSHHLEKTKKNLWTSVAATALG